MKLTQKGKMLLLLALAAVSAGISSHAGNSVSQTVTIQIDAINEISVSGNPGALVIAASTAGSAPNQATDASTTYAITTNQTGKKIVGAINSAMPSGTALNVQLAATTTGSSAGSVALSTTQADLVTGIANVSDTSKSITYTFSATAGAAPLTSTTRTVTLTIL